MKFPNAILVFAVILVAGRGLAVAPTDKDISWTGQGGVKVAGWMVIEEDYGLPVVNTIIKQTKNTIEYSNDVVRISKEWRIEDNSLIVKQKITPLNERGRRSKLILKIKALQQFESFFTPAAFTAPKVSGRWIKSGEMESIEVPRGAYSNAMTYTILRGKKGSIMLDRVITNDYLAYEGGISGAAGDFSALTWPIFAFGHWSWNLGHLGPKGEQQAWMENEYPEGGGSAEYRLHFFKDMPQQEVTSKSYGAYLRTRKKAADDWQIYKGWEKAHRASKDKIAFYAFIGPNWNPVGIPGRGGWKGPENFPKAIPYYVENFKRMRAILDENGMEDAYIYFWVQNCDGRDAGWGQFPPDVKPVKVLFERLRKEVHHMRLGIYVNFWICPSDVKVYKEHPDWFTKQFHWSDAGTKSYAGKLPEWGDWLVGQMPAFIKAYDLDFIFFDGAGWVSRWRGSHEQAQKFFTDISNIMHDNDAEFWANGNVPFVDVGMEEHVAGESLASDYDLATNFKDRSYHEYMMGPMFSWRSWKPLLFFRSGQSLVDNFGDRPEFLVRWPVHYWGEDMEYILKEFFTPYVKKRAAALKKAGN